MSAKKKKSIVSKKTISRKPQVTSSMGQQYDTQMIITILLLLFIYPLGLIFMWAWMRSWPMWVKIVISLPLIISVLFVVFIIFAVGKIIHNKNYVIYNYEKQAPMMQEDSNPGNPTVSPYKMY